MILNEWVIQINNLGVLKVNEGDVQLSHWINVTRNVLTHFFFECNYRFSFRNFRNVHAQPMIYRSVPTAIEKSIENAEVQNVIEEKSDGYACYVERYCRYSYVLYTRDNVICNLILHFYLCNGFLIAASTRACKTI